MRVSAFSVRSTSVVVCRERLTQWCVGRVWSHVISVGVYGSSVRRRCMAVEVASGYLIRSVSIAGV